MTIITEGAEMRMDGGVHLKGDRFGDNTVEDAAKLFFISIC